MYAKLANKNSATTAGEAGTDAAAAATSTTGEEGAEKTAAGAEAEKTTP